jgi:uncharacterized membrane protein YedE/YeeE
MSSNVFLFKLFIYLLSGLIFGLGLAISGMTDPKIVQGFLDIFGDWNLSLIFVMVAGISITSIGYRIIFKNDKPNQDEQFFISTKKLIDKPLILGAVIFGLGWGLYGFCPGPAIASLASLNPQTFAFVFSMAFGMFLANKASPLFNK